MARDNFSKKIIQEIRERVGGLCSNPECRALTTAAKKTSGVNNIGVGAHICAAAPGGPRYDPNMSSSERASGDNAIWLCSNCGSMIDRDEQKYTVPLLKQWKKDAEIWAQNELGKKPIFKETMASYISAASNATPSKEILVSGVAKFHQAFSLALSELDPRFGAITHYHNGLTSTQLYAKEKVDLNFSFPYSVAKDIQSQLINYGSSIKIDTKNMSVEGSNLIEFIHKRSVLFEISAVPKIVNVTLTVDGNSGTEIIGVMDGQLYLGKLGFTLEGKMWKNLFDLKFLVSSYTEKFEGNTNIKIHFNKWHRRDLLQLPYFEKIFSLAKSLKDGKVIKCTVEYEGDHLFHVNINGNNSDSFLQIFDNLFFLHCCRKIASYFQTTIYLDKNIELSDEHVNTVYNIYALTEGPKKIYKERCASNATATLPYDESLCKKLESSENLDIAITQEIELFNQPIENAYQVFRLHDVMPSIRNSSKKMKNGDDCIVEFIPGKNYYWENYLEKCKSENIEQRLAMKT